MFLRHALLIAGAGLAVAQSMSSQCSSALLAVASSPQATCLGLSLLAPLALSNSSTSVIPTINNWLTGVCSQGPCSNATLQAVVSNITTGCSSDLANLGLAANDSSTIAATVEAGYPVLRQVSCLMDMSTNTLCATEQLTNIQSSTATAISINSIIGLIGQFMSGTTLNLPQNILCSNCTKAAYTIVVQHSPSLVTNDQSMIQSDCGSSFTDGQMPSNIQELASNSTSSSMGGAASLSVSSLNVGVAMLIAVFSAFVILA